MIFNPWLSSLGSTAVWGYTSGWEQPGSLTQTSLSSHRDKNPHTVQHHQSSFKPTFSIPTQSGQSLSYPQTTLLMNDPSWHDQSNRKVVSTTKCSTRVSSISQLCHKSATDRRGEAASLPHRSVTLPLLLLWKYHQITGLLSGDTAGCASRVKFDEQQLYQCIYHNKYWE